MTTLREFLSHPDYTARNPDDTFIIDDATALVNAQNHPETTGVFFNNNTLNSLLIQEKILVPLEKIALTDGHTWQNEAKGFLNSNEYNFIRGNGTSTGDKQWAIFDDFIAANVSVDVAGMPINVSQGMANIKPIIDAIANKTTYPLAGVTLEQIKAERYPAMWLPVTIASGNDKIVLPEGDTLLSSSNKAAFRFTITPAETFNGQVRVRIWAKRADQPGFTIQSSYPVNINRSWVTNQPETHVFQRTAGLSGYRHFQFEVLAPYAGAIGEVSVEGVV